MLVIACIVLDIIVYILCAILSLFLFQKIDLKFVNEKNNTLELNEIEEMIIIFKMSLLWIYYLPKIYFINKGRRK